MSCKVNYATLHTENLSGITITDNSITSSEKIRHLNEINSWPTPMLDIMRANIPIKLTHGGITNLPDYAYLKGQTPRGWPAGSTWDMVPGTGTEAGLILGDSSLGNNAWSLATHEGTHSIDRKLALSSHNADIINAYNAEKNSPNAQDSNGAYRMSNIEEWLAIAVDEYLCNDQTKANLKAWYPKSYDLVEKKWLPMLTSSGVGVAAQTNSNTNTTTMDTSASNTASTQTSSTGNTQTIDMSNPASSSSMDTMQTTASDQNQNTNASTVHSSDADAAKAPNAGTYPGIGKDSKSSGVIGCD